MSEPLALTGELVEELNALVLFDLEVNRQGIKVHKTASAETIAAVKRLYAKGLITQVDGGYLTPMGIEAAEATHRVVGLLKSGEAAKIAQV